MTETQASICDWIVATFGTVGSNMSVAARANQEMAELVMALAVDDNHPKAVEEAADIVIILYRLADRMGRDLQAAIDAKMAINRRREWNVANGHGYHVKGRQP
jgi:NTP pyrophosphatase (non-canonical NTP hydrolase)